MPSSLQKITKEVVSLNINLITYKNAIDTIMEMARNREQGYVCFANVHMVIEGHNDKAFQQQVNKASLVLADGMPLVKTLDFLYGEKQDRVAGMDIMPDLIRSSELYRLKIFFFGTTQDILDKIKLRVRKDYPRAEIAGMLSPPFDKSLDDPSYIERINESGANLVFVALGCPKQEKWMAKHSDGIKAVLLGVGGAFPVFAGQVSRAPRFMQNAGLEWLFRLWQEPNRLFKRYLTTNSQFIWHILKIKFRRR